MVKSKQRVISVVLAVLIAFSALFAGTASAFAVDTTNTDSGATVQIVPSELPSKIYMKLNSDWGKDSPRFSAYFFVDDNTNTWVDMTEVSGETDMYSCTVPSGGNWTHVIFCRMNPATSENNWNNKWNQTADIPLDSSKNLCTLNGGWDNISGTWSTYAGEEEPTDPTTAPTAPTTPTQAPTTPTSTPTDPTVADKLMVNGTAYSLGDTFTYTTTLQNAARLSTIGGHVNLSGDADMLTCLTSSQTAACPNLSGNAVVNFTPNDGSNSIYFNAIDASAGYDFSTAKTLVTLEFSVNAVGGNVNITTVIDELYDLNKNSATSTAKTTTSISGGSIAPTTPGTGVTINGTKYNSGDVIEYVGYLSSTDNLYAISGNITYNNNYVQLSDVQLSDSEMFPILAASGSFKYDLNTVANRVSFNAMSSPSLGGYNFTGSNAVLAKLRFVVTASSGSTTISTNITEAYSMSNTDSDGLPAPVNPTATDTVKIYGSDNTDPTEEGYVYVNGERAQKGDTIVFTVKAQYAKKLQMTSANMEWDPSYLSLVQQNDSVSFPILSQSGGLIANYDATASASNLNRCRYSAVSPTGQIDLTNSDSVYATFTFTVIADSGSTRITNEITDTGASESELLNPISYDDTITVNPGSVEPTAATDPTEPGSVVINGVEFNTGDIIEYVAYLQSDEMIGGLQFITHYDSDYVRLCSDQPAQADMYPNLTNALSIYDDFNNYPEQIRVNVMANYSPSASGFDFSADDTEVAVFRFEVTGNSGETSIYSDFLSVLSFENLNQIGAPEPVDDYTNDDVVRLYQAAPTQPTDAPTQPTEEPTQPTDAPTQPTNPPTQPTDPTEPGSVVINGVEFNTGDIIEYVAYLQSDEMIGGLQFITHYDSDYVRLCSDQPAQADMYPNLTNALSIYDDFNNYPEQIRVNVMANYSPSASGFDFSADDTEVAVFRFEVTGNSGETSIYSDFLSVLSFENLNQIGAPEPVDDYTNDDVVRLYQAAPTQPTDAPTQPTEEPTQPTDAPTQPTNPPTQPTDPPTQPTDPPTQPTDPPTQPTDPPTQPTDPPTQPQELTVNGQKAENGDQVVYKVYLNAGASLSDVEAVVDYSSDIIELSKLSISAGVGIFGDGTYSTNSPLNLIDADGTINLTLSNDNGYDYRTNRLFVTLVFNVIADDGTGTIDIDFNSITNTAGSSVNSPATTKTTTVLPDEAKNDYFMGDVNGDGYVSVADAIEVQRVIANLTSVDDLANTADIDHSGSITVADAIEIQRYIANISGFMYPAIYR